MYMIHRVYKTVHAQTVSTILDQCAKDMATICSYMPSVHKLVTIWKLSSFPPNTF